MKQIYILVIIIAGFLFSPMAWGQDDNYQQKKDSLSRIIPKQTGEEKLSSYWDLTHYHFLTLEDDESLEKLFQLLDEYQAEAKKQNHLGALGSIIVTKTDAFYNLSKRDEMIQYVYENVEFLRKNELWKNYYSVCQAVFDAYLLDGKTETALREAKKLYDFAKEKQHPSGMMALLYTMGCAYEKQNRPANAIPYFKQCIDIYKANNDSGQKHLAGAAAKHPGMAVCHVISLWGAFFEVGLQSKIILEYPS